MQRQPASTRPATTPQAGQAVSGAQISALEDRRAALKSQLSSLTERRVLLSVQMGSADGAAKRDLEARIAELDTRSRSIDDQLNRVDDQINAALEARTAPAVRAIQQRSPDVVVSVPPPFRMRPSNDAIMGMLAFQSIALVLFGIFLWRMLRRRGGAGTARLAPEDASRLDQLQRAVDVMAVEVERISEGQRYVTKVLSEKVTVDR